MNVKIANQNTGVISTPNAGGILPFASLRRGSEGHATTAHGNSFKFVSGYHDATTRHNIAKDMKFKNGPNTVAVGCTQASVSANKSPLPDVIAIPTVSESEDAIDGSIIDKADVHGVAIGDVGVTKAETPLIAIARHKIVDARFMVADDCLNKVCMKIDG